MAQKWDLFDVHSGLVSMEEYLLQRGHTEDDLQSVVEIPAEKWVEFVKPPPPPPKMPERPRPEFVIQAPPEPAEPSLEELMENFQKAAQDWEERNQ